MENRTFVIGDIHGAYKALIQVMDKLKPTEKDTFIFLGDYVDGWKESFQVINYLIEFGKKYNCIFLRGNHDIWLEEYLVYGVILKVWIENGGKSTLDNYLEISPETKLDHIDFLNSLHNYYVDEKNRGFVHGGFVSRKGLGYEHHSSNYYWDRDLWKIAFLTVNQKEDASKYRFDRHKEIYIGHTSTCNWIAKPHYPEFEKVGNNRIDIPMNRSNVWNIDTGAGFKGKLTAINIDTKDYYQSDYVHTLYPDDKGRN